MHWIKRTDGLDGTHAAHREDALGGLNEVVRDRSVPPEQSTLILAQVSELRPGDGEITEAEYDALAQPLYVSNYETVFIPHAQAESAKNAGYAAGIADALSRAPFEIPSERGRQGELQARADAWNAKATEDAAELVKLRTDTSVRLRRAAERP